MVDYAVLGFRVRDLNGAESDTEARESRLHIGFFDEPHVIAAESPTAESPTADGRPRDDAPPGSPAPDEEGQARP
jgi:hypothetical protein